MTRSLTPTSAEESHFALWLPICHVDDTTTTCTFDVTAFALRTIREGTREAMEEMVRTLGFEDPHVSAWELQAFRTPYYSYDPAVAEWMDRVVEAWHVRVTLDDTGYEPGYLGRGPIGSDAWDATAAGQHFFERPARARCVVLADSKEDGPLPFLSDLPATAEVTARTAPGMPFTQFRIDLGVIDVPGGLTMVDSVLEMAREAGMLTLWSDFWS